MSRITRRTLFQVSLRMDDELREELHGSMAPCAPEDFLREYRRRCDPGHWSALVSQFPILADIGQMHSPRTRRAAGSGPAYAWEVAECAICLQRAESGPHDGPSSVEDAQEDALDRLATRPCVAQVEGEE